MKLKSNHLFFWLHYSRITRLKAKRLLSQYNNDIAEVFDAVNRKDSKLVSVVDTVTLGKISATADESIILEAFNRILKNGIEIIAQSDSIMPELLKEEAVDPPLILFAKGDLDILDTDKFAVVGMRKCSEYGARSAKRFASELSKAGLTIVSGLAEGIDTAAHRAVLEVKGKTITIIANGFDRIYPSFNRGLFNAVVKEGLALSEYYPDATAAKYTFPERNRLVSGCSIGCLIVESDKSGGSLITAEHALSQGRDVFVIPGRIDMDTNVGTNMLIKSAQCAMVLEPQDILDELKIHVKKILPKKDNIKLDNSEKIVYNILLKKGKTHFNEICSLSGLDTVSLNSILFNLEEKNLAVKFPGNYYSL